MDYVEDRLLLAAFVLTVAFAAVVTKAHKDLRNDHSHLLQLLTETSVKTPSDGWLYTVEGENDEATATAGLHRPGSQRHRLLDRRPAGDYPHSHP